MGYIPIALHQVLSGLSSSFRSVEVRVAGYRGPIAQPPTEEWQPLRSLIRISFRDAASVRDRYAELRGRVRCNATPEFAMFQDILLFSDLPRVPSAHGLAVRILHGRPHIEVVPVSSGELTGFVSRFRDRGRPVRTEEWPTIDYYFVPPASPPAGAVNLGRLQAEIRRHLGIANADTLLRLYLEDSDPNNQAGSVFIQIEMPAMISSMKPRRSSIDIEIRAERNLGGVNLFVSKRKTDGVGIEEQVLVPLTILPSTGDLGVLAGTAELKDLAPQDSVEFVLTHPEIPELDDVVRRIRDLMPITELNPLLVCLRRFWNLDDRFRVLDRPYVTKPGKVDVRPQTVFQSRVAELLTLAGFQTVDLGRKDVMREPSTQVEIATADILASHAGGNLLLIGACTINVPKTEDYEKLLHVTSILEQELPEGTQLAIVPVLFTGQEPDSVLKEQASPRGLKLVTGRDLVRIRSLIDAGKEDQVISFLTSPIGELFQ